MKTGNIPASLVYAAAKGTDAVMPLFGLQYGAALWAQVLTQGCGYSNEKMKRIVGELRKPTIHDGIPEMIDWFKKSRP